MEHQRDQVSWAAARAIGTTSQLLLSDLSTATTAARVACCLRTAVSLFSIHQVHTSADQSGPKAAAPQGVTEDDLLQRCYEQLQPHAAMLGWDQLSSLFYQCQFSAWAAGVLTGVHMQPAAEVQTQRGKWILSNCKNALMTRAYHHTECMHIFACLCLIPFVSRQCCSGSW